MSCRSGFFVSWGSARLRRAGDVLGKLWASPCTAAGMGYGLCCHLLSWMLGAKPQLCLGNNAIQFINNLGIRKGSALTLGNVILYGRGADPDAGGAYGDRRVNLGRHERAHTYQYQLLGPLFMPVYWFCGSFGGPDKNCLERAAQHYATGKGSWWPAPE